MVGDSGERGDEAGGPTGGVGGAGGGGGGPGGFSTVVICESWCCPGLVWICRDGKELQSKCEQLHWFFFSHAMQSSIGGHKSVYVSFENKIRMVAS